MKNLLLIVSLIVIGSKAYAVQGTEGRVAILRDRAYEQNLRWEASADKTVTPSKVFRWMKGLRGQALAAPSKTEFQPIVNVQDTHVRVIAAIAYKF